MGLSGSSGIDRRELVREVMRAIEEDVELRYALMGLLGFTEILERITRLEEGYRRLEERFAKLEEEFLELRKRQDRLEEEVGEVKRQLRELNTRASNLEMVVGALAESFYSRSLWEDLREELRARRERVVERRHNAYIDGEKVDLLVVTDKSVYVVEVKVKPKIRDVGALLAKADLAARRYPGRRVAPVLAGTMVGGEVEEYARQKGVLVYSY